jgi:hypothetical protein
MRRCVRAAAAQLLRAAAPHAGADAAAHAAAARRTCAAARRASSSAAGSGSGGSGSGSGDGSADAAATSAHAAAAALREVDISVDRSGLYHEPGTQPHAARAALALSPATDAARTPRKPCPTHAHRHANTPADLHAPRPQDTPLERHLRSVIRFRGGPLPVADFMSEVLTHPTLGYYMTRDVFGTAGDFVTSPEVSQIFGELCAVWGACLWDAMGRPPKVTLVELGPGRGTLMADLLRCAAALPGGFAAALEVHLVEVSPALRRMQAAALGCGPAAGAVGAGATPSGTRVRWHGALATVPEGPLILFAHEFFDALPVHQFQRTPRGWCERLVDSGMPEASEAAEGENADGGAAAAAAAPALRFVLSRGATPAARLLVPRRLAALPPDQAASQWALEARTPNRISHPHAIRTARPDARSLSFSARRSARAPWRRGRRWLAAWARTAAARSRLITERRVPSRTRCRPSGSTPSRTCWTRWAART